MERGEILKYLYIKQRMNIKLGGDMFARIEIGRRVRQELLSIYLEDLVNNCLQKVGAVVIGVGRKNCIRFSDDMALLVEEEMTLRNMLIELNGRCVCSIG